MLILFKCWIRYTFVTFSFCCEIAKNEIEISKIKSSNNEKFWNSSIEIEFELFELSWFFEISTNFFFSNFAFFAFESFAFESSLRENKNFDVKKIWTKTTFFEYVFLENEIFFEKSKLFSNRKSNQASFFECQNSFISNSSLCSWKFEKI